MQVLTSTLDFAAYLAAVPRASARVLLLDYDGTLAPFHPDPAQAVPLAHALLAGGIDVMEITLRHAAGLAGIQAVARSVPHMHVGAGTVTRGHEFKQVRQAGARFALSPGLTPELHEAATDAGLPFIPGAMTPSEVMQARQWGTTRSSCFRRRKPVVCPWSGRWPVLWAMCDCVPPAVFPRTTWPIF